MVSIAQYWQYFDHHKIPYDIICTDPYGEDDETTAEHIYKVNTVYAPNALQKIKNYARFIYFAKKTLLKQNYDLIVLRNEITAVLFAGFLCSHYKGKYIVSVKDLFNEHSKIKNANILTRLLNKVVKGSYLTTVSSPAFCDFFINKNKSLLVHNISPQVLPEKRVLTSSDMKKTPIIILYSGHISYPQYACKMIDRFKNDNRFFMRVIGNGSESVKKYADLVGCKNIEVSGGFKSSSTMDVLTTGDILFNVYGNDNHCEQTALSNKLYYAVCMQIPIIVSHSTYMAKVTTDLGIGFEIDFDSPNDICTQLYDWYRNFDQSKVEHKCEEFRQEALMSHNNLFEKLNTFFALKGN
jgi:hypothetical protein